MCELMHRVSAIFLLVYPEAIKESTSLSLDVNKSLAIVFPGELAEDFGSNRNFVIVFLEYHKSPFKIATMPLGMVWGGSVS